MKPTSAIAVLAGSALLFGGTTDRAVEAAVGTSDYTVTTPSGLWEDPPAGGSTTVGAPYNKATTVELPFPFMYFGEPVPMVDITHYGALICAIGSLFSNSNGNFATIAAGTSSSGRAIIAPLWDDLSPQSFGTLQYWTAGTAPNRRWICSWIDYGNYQTPASSYQFQVKLYEGTSRVEFAYKPESSPSTWIGMSYTQGMNSRHIDDPRYVCPVSAATNLAGHPPTDYRFDPRMIDITGRATFERLVPSAAGLGTAAVATPHAGGRIELRRGTVVIATTNADAAGDFVFHVPAGHIAQTGQIYALTENDAVTVLAPAGVAPLALQVAIGVSLQTSADLGTLAVTTATDAQAAWRAPANVARAALDAWSFVSARTSESIPKLDVHVDSASAGSTYHPAGTSTAATLEIAGATAANPDAWDDPVVQREYARHVLASIAGPFPGAPDTTFDKATSPANAFAEAFGYWLWAAVTDGRVFVDATSTTTADTIDLDDPQPASSRGPDVAAWVTAALFDLVDAANESHDWTDGSAAERGRPLTVIAAATAPPTAALFYDGWRAAAFPASALSRNFVAHGLLSDDAFEPNDVTAETRELAAAPARTTGLVLARDSEDWFDVACEGSSIGMTAEMAFDRAATPATIHLQVLGPAGQLLADRLDAGTGVVTASTGPVAAGKIRIRVRHAGGAFVPSYALQVAATLSVPSESLPSWTEGRPYARAFPVSGGVPPYTFEVSPPTGAPPGVAFDASTLRAFGTPTTPGEYDFLVITRDSGVPAHQASTSQHVVIAEPLDLALPEFVTFAAGRPTDVTYSHAGGTSPLEVVVAAGELPTGVAMDADGLRFRGSASALGSVKAHIAGTDAAGSADATDVTSVVCAATSDAAPTAPLAEGESACGFWFDAVAGSRAALSVGTVKGKPKRAVRIAVLAAGGGPVAAAVLKPGNGKASAAFDVPISGRWFVVVASASGAATQLTAKLGLAAPKKGAGALTDFGPGDVREATFGALAGATLSFSATPDKSAGVTANVLALLRPDGTAVPLAGLVTQKGANVTLAAPLDQSGTWTVRLRGQGGQDGGLRYAYKLKQPKGVVYSAE